MAVVLPDDTYGRVPPSLASMSASTIQRQNSRSLWNSGPRGTNRRHPSLDDIKPAAKDRGMLACASSLRTKHFPGLLPPTHAIRNLETALSIYMWQSAENVDNLQELAEA